MVEDYICELFSATALFSIWKKSECRNKGNQGLNAELMDGLKDMIQSHEEEQRAKGPRELRTAHPHDIEDCENLLENYFMQVSFQLFQSQSLSFPFTVSSFSIKIWQWKDAAMPKLKSKSEEIFAHLGTIGPCAQTEIHRAYGMVWWPMHSKSRCIIFWGLALLRLL